VEVNVIFESVSVDDIKDAMADSKRSHFFTSFEHLSAHYGIRRGCYGVYMGTTGSGKSSLIKSIIVQTASTKDTTVLVWLSEEKKAKYANGMHLYASKVGLDIGKIKWFEESSIDHAALKTHDDFLQYFKEVIAASGADAVFIDNITTSRLYGAQTALWDQGKSVEALKRVSQDLDIAITCVAHTGSNVSDNMGRLFTTEDIKGLKAISMEASYFYSLQKFTKANEIFLTLRTLKFREHNNAAGTYLLKYDHQLSVHVGDSKISFEDVNTIFKERDFLGRK
jgi:energy-coupling factor transporter ATP-binding protein EcfA2